MRYIKRQRDIQVSREMYTRSTYISRALEGYTSYEAQFVYIPE